MAELKIFKDDENTKLILSLEEEDLFYGLSFLITKTITKRNDIEERGLKKMVSRSLSSK